MLPMLRVYSSGYVLGLKEKNILLFAFLAIAGAAALLVAIDILSFIILCAVVQRTIPKDAGATAEVRTLFFNRSWPKSYQGEEWEKGK